MPTKLERNRKAAEEKGYIAKAHAAEEKYGIPKGMFVGLLEQESAWRPEVISGKKKSKAGAIGIAQFMPATAKDEGVDPLNVDQAIDGGAAYLARMKDSAGSWTGALTAYNWGIGNYQKWLKGERKTQPKEAREYAGKVQRRAKAFQSTVPRTNESGAQPSGATPEGNVAGLRSRPTKSGSVRNESTPSQIPAPPSTAGVQVVGETPTSAYNQALIPPPAAIPEPALPTAAPLPAIAPPNTPVTAPSGIGTALIPPPARALPQRGQRAETFKLKQPKKLQVEIATPVGPRSVQAETPEEEALIQDLAQSGETQMLALMPELIKTRDLARSAPLIKTRGDSVDKLLLEIVEGVN